MKTPQDHSKELFLTRLSVHRPITTIMVCLIVALLGVVSFAKLPIDLMPDTQYPRIAMSVAYEGAGPREIETLITRPLEEMLTTVDGVESVQSISFEGSCRAFVDLSWGSDTGDAMHEIQQTLARNRQSFPEEMGVLTMYRYDPSDQPIMWLRIQSDREPMALTRYIDQYVIPRLERISGVARVRFDGAVRREIQVDLDRAKLQSRNIPISEVVAALQREDVVHRAGDVQRGRLRVLVQTQATFESLDDIANTVIRKRGDAVVRIKDVGKVIDGHEHQRLVMRMDGKPSMALLVYKQTGTNTVAVSDAVHSAVEDFNAEETQAKLSVRHDFGDAIRQSIRNVRRALLSGMVLAGIVLIVFLRNIRSTLVIALSMPISVLATLTLLYFSGLTLNMISFGGLALGIGLLVDNSIVVLENIFRKRVEGLDPRSAAISGTGEVGAAITASTITTLVVFVPLLFIDGPSGILLRQLAFVISMAVLSSLLMSITVTPMLTTLLRQQTDSAPTTSGAPSAKSSKNRSTERGRLVRGYSGILAFCLRRPGLATMLLLAAFSCSMGLTPLVGTELMPKTDGGVVRVYGSMAPGIQAEPLQRQVAVVERALEKLVPEAETIYARMGSTAEYSGYYHRFTCDIHLKPPDERTRTAEEIRKDLMRRLPDSPGVNLGSWAFSTRSGFEGLRSLGNAGLQFQVHGDDPATTERLAKKLADAIREIPGIVNVNIEKQDRLESMTASIDRQLAGALGITTTEVARVIESEIRGTEAAKYREAGDEFQVVVRMREADRRDTSDIDRVGVPASNGRVLPVKSLVSLSHGVTSSAIRRVDRQRTVLVRAGVEGRDLGGAVAEVRKTLNKVTDEFPDGYSVVIGGDWKQQQRSFRAMRVGLVMALVLMYMVMASQFESLRDPLLILVTVPLGAIGVVLALVLTKTTLNVQSFIGIVMLAGIVVNNAIVLIDSMNQLRRGNPALSIDAVVQIPAARRFRPILMTTLTTILAMLPIAIGWGEGGEIQAPMARVVIGGLTSATLITLVAIPLAYRFLRRREPLVHPGQRPEPPFTAPREQLPATASNAT